jgi:hypothetical protein
MELFYYTANEAAVRCQKVESRRVDTITFSSTGVPPNYRDSVTVRSSEFKYVLDYIGYGMSETFGTDFSRFFSVYAGPGFSIRYSMNSKVTEASDIYSDIKTTGNPHQSYDETIYGINKSPKTIAINVSSAYAWNLYITGGMNLRIIKFKNAQLLFNTNFRLGGGRIKIDHLKKSRSQGVQAINFALRFVFF